MVKNLPSNAGHVGSILVEELSLHIAIKMQCSQNFFKKKAAERSNPTSKERRLRGGAERSYSTFKVRRGGREKIPLVQGKEQQLRFAGAAMKRYPTSKVRETQVRR